MKTSTKKTAASVLSATSVFILAALILLPAPNAARAQRDSVAGHLLETGDLKSANPDRQSHGELKIVCYNVRWRGGDDLRKLIELLRDDPEIGGAAIIGLQEVDRNKKRTNHANTARIIAEGLGMHYAWAAPPTDDEEEETGVVILSRFPLTQVERLVLPHEGPDGRRRVALGATAHVGQTPVRVYSVHAETRMPLEKKIEHWRAVLDDLSRFPAVRHAAVMGDFNTIKGKDVRAARKLFTEAGFTTPFPDDRSTWRTFIIDLKLDWVWLKGFETSEFGIDKQVKLSDHWPLWVKVNIDPTRRRAPSSADATTSGQTR